MEVRQQLHALETHLSAPESRDTAFLILAGQNLSLLTSVRGSGGSPEVPPALGAVPGSWILTSHQQGWVPRGGQCHDDPC